MRKWFIFLLLSLFFAFVPVAQAAQFQVSAGDVAGLIAAINMANDETNHPGSDTITLQGGIYTLNTAYPLGGGTDTNGLPTITSYIRIRGNGAVIERSPGASEEFRIFHVASVGALKLDEVTIRGGRATIYPFGGGILNYGRLEVNSSTLQGNEGAAISNVAGALTVINSTLTDNTGTLGSGIFGSADRWRRVELINTTVTNNDAFAAIYISGIRLTNTIVANNVGRNCAGGSVVSNGHNLDSDGTCNLYATGDLPFTDPLLGELQNNGGKTETQALLEGSPAINAGDNAVCPLTDQRGIPRPLGAACDIGAYEAAASASSLKLDQSNIFTDGGAWSIQQLGPVGQAFVPTLPVMDRVELWTADGDPQTSGVALQVYIRENSISGQVIGTSSITSLTDGFSGIARFDFPEAVPLVPGNLYVLEVVAVSGDNWMVGWNEDTYSSGYAIVLGEPAGSDLWFREWAMVEGSR